MWVVFPACKKERFEGLNLSVGLGWKPGGPIPCRFCLFDQLGLSFELLM